MVHISELSWGHIRTPGEVVKPGDQIEVFVLKFDPEKKKISLGYKTPEDVYKRQISTSLRSAAG